MSVTTHHYRVIFVLYYFSYRAYCLRTNTTLLEIAVNSSSERISSSLPVNLPHYRWSIETEIALIFKRLWILEFLDISELSSTRARLCFYEHCHACDRHNVNISARYFPATGLCWILHILRTYRCKVSFLLHEFMPVSPVKNYSNSVLAYSNQHSVTTKSPAPEEKLKTR